MRTLASFLAAGFLGAAYWVGIEWARALVELVNANPIGW